MRRGMQRSTSVGTAIAERIVLSTDTKANSPQTTTPATKVSRINLNAAFLAFPEYFIRPEGKG
jgi:hypothetical protein